MKFKLLCLCMISFLCFANANNIDVDTESKPPVTDSYKSHEKYHFTIQQKNYSFSSFFEIDSEDTYRGNVKKSQFRLRDHYDLSDKDGWCATGIKRMFSLGSLYDWAAEIDVFGVNDEFLGAIEGKVLTTAKARFLLFDKNREVVGIAFIDLDGKGVTITDPKNETYALARLTRNFVLDIQDDWSIIVYEPENLDDRLIRIFAAFCIDSQDSFHKDI
ncbi:MAG: hypothetical protein K940chlam5_00204 [Candidatus Anoxychlamydiales bacterium]|nr:hypothetical protein [Candidatus Anoxychlamydiales bacterium]